MSLLTSLMRLVPPSFRAGYCPASLQQLANDLINGTQVTFLVQQGSFLYNFGSATPAAENRIWPWLNTTDGRWYTFQFGLWVSPMDPSDREPSFRKMWKPNPGTPESALWALDGGDGTDPTLSPPTVITGAAWMVDHAFDGMFPVAAGLIPGSNPAVTLSFGGTGGSNLHTLTQAELPNINLHATTKMGSTDPQDPGITFLANVASALPDNYDLSVPLGGGGNAFSIMPPYRVIYWIQPTIRKYFTLPA